MGDRRCCCGEQCLFAEDQFDREDEEPVVGWTEVSGDWEIKDTELYEPGNPGAKLLHNNHATEPGSFFVKVKAIGPVEGQSYIVYVDCDDTVTQFHYAKFTKGASSEWTVEIGNEAGVLDSKDMTETVISVDYTDLYVCIDPAAFRAYIPSFDEYPWVNDEGVYSNDRTGVGHPNSIPTIFDDFYAYKTRYADLLCESCRCSCLTRAIGKDLLGTFTGCSGRASCLEGLTVNLTWNWGAGAEYWSGNGSGDAAGINFKLSCNEEDSQDVENPGVNLLLENTGICCQPAPADCIKIADGGSTECDPLNAVFGPYNARSSDLGCAICGHTPLDGVDGEYSIVVTEVP